MHWPAGVAALVLVGTALAPVYAASSTFSASTLQWDGPSTIEVLAPVVDYRLQPEDGGAFFALSAESVRMTTIAQTKVVVPTLVSTTTQRPQASVQDFGASTWSWASRASESGIFVSTDAQSILDASPVGGRISIPIERCLEQPTYFTTGQEPACPSLESAVQISTTISQWVLKGNFSLHLWSWNGTMDRQAYWSGAQPSDTSALGIGEHQYQAIRIDVTNATMDFYGPLLAVKLHGVHGRVATDNSFVTLPGLNAKPAPGIPQASVLLISRSDQGLAVDVLDGTDLRHTGIAAGLQAPITPLLAFLMALALAILLIVARRRRARMHLLEASQNMLRGNYLAAARHASDARKHKDFRHEAGILGAVALLRAGKLQDAESFIDALQPSTHRAAIAYLKGNLRVLQGRIREAKSFLEECMALDETLETEIAANPILVGLVSLPRRASRHP